MSHLIIFALGVMLGTFVGIFIAGLCAMASDRKEDDAAIEKMLLDGKL